jgi:hypothetical protein
MHKTDVGKPYDSRWQNRNPAMKVSGPEYFAAIVAEKNIVDAHKGHLLRRSISFLNLPP